MATRKINQIDPNLPNDSGDVALELYRRQLFETNETARGLMKALQDEILVNTKIRAEVQKDIQLLHDFSEKLDKLIFRGNGSQPLISQVYNITKELNNIMEKIKQLGDLENKNAVTIETKDKILSERIDIIKDLLEKKLKDELLATEERLKEIINQKDQAREIIDKSNEKWGDKLWSLFVQLAPHIIGWLALLTAWLVTFQKREP